MKKYTDVLREYAKRLNDDDLKYLNMRLTHRLGGDVGEAIEFMQRNQEIDRWLSSAGNATDFFDMLDSIDSSVQQEVKKRFGSYEQAKEKSKASAATASAAGR